MRISDWSSDVCSSDLSDAQLRGDDVPDFMQIAGVRELPSYWAPFASPAFTLLAIVVIPTGIAAGIEEGDDARRVVGRPIGRASHRERVCRYVYISVVAVSFNKKQAIKRQKPHY